MNLRCQTFKKTLHLHQGKILTSNIVTCVVHHQQIGWACRNQIYSESISILSNFVTKFWKKKTSLLLRNVQLQLVWESESVITVSLRGEGPKDGAASKNRRLELFRLKKVWPYLAFPQRKQINERPQQIYERMTTITFANIMTSAQNRKFLFRQISLPLFSFPCIFLHF